LRKPEKGIPVLTREVLNSLQKLDQDKILIIITKQNVTLHIRTLRKLRQEDKSENIVLTTFSGFALSVSGVVSRLQRNRAAAGTVLVQYQENGDYWEISGITDDKNSDMVTIRLGTRATGIDDDEMTYIR
jgi:hypothetical protein